jgi:hypothetical protein
MEAEKLVIQVDRETGAVKHGAAGFLYGLGNEGVPNLQMLAPLKPGVAAQKPPGGLQHPNGDAFEVAATFSDAGGRQIQIYMQDAYAQWPYESQDIGDYLERVAAMVQKVAAHPRKERFAYVPFNEPDWIWYNAEDRRDAFFEDWLTVYREIRRLDPSGPIVGPNIANYHEGFLESFMSFCKSEACLPDIVSWHELDPKFFSDWHRHLEHYRGIERSLGLPAKPICINEYGNWRDLSVPGRLIQWLARFEDSKVEGCLAYWHAAGNLDDLVTRNNEATGAWWLFKWYGELTGNTVAVHSSRAAAEGLQGIAAWDAEKLQLRVVFGGCADDCDIVLKGLAAVSGFVGGVHAELWSVAWSGHEGPSAGPVAELESDFPVTDGATLIPVRGMDAASAYLLIVTGRNHIAAGGVRKAWQGRYEAEDAQITAGQIVEGGTPAQPNRNYHSGRGRVGELGQDASRVRFTVAVPYSGSYALDIFYGNGHGAMAGQWLGVDERDWRLLEYHPNLAWGFIDRKTVPLELKQGRHTIILAKYVAAAGRAELAVDLDKIVLTHSDPAPGPRHYPAAYAELLGMAKLGREIGGYSGNGYVLLGGGDAGMRFVTSQASHGFYRIRIRYAIASHSEEPETSTIPALSININGAAWELPRPESLNPNQWQDAACQVFLPAGISQITFGGHIENPNQNIALDSIALEEGNGPVASYEAEAPENTLAGSAKVGDDAYASAGKYVRDIGNGAENFLQFNGITVEADGTYCMVIDYANAEKVGAHQYNVNIVDRYADIRINGREIRRVYFRNTFGWNSYRSKTVHLELKAGANTIRFSNAEAAAPHIDKITIAPFQT